MYKDYRKIKAKQISEIVDINRNLIYRRKVYNRTTGEEEQVQREDIIDIAYLESVRDELLSELEDIKELLKDAKAKKATKQ